MARSIQEKLLPAAAPELPGLEIGGVSNPAEFSSGDYFDYITLSDGNVGIVIADKRRQLRGMKSKLSRKVEAGEMTREELNAAMTKFEAELISPEEAALLQRGASNAGYHYLGCAKTFALMGKACADAMLDLMRSAAASSDGR